MHAWVRSPEGAKVARYEFSLTSKPTATARRDVNEILSVVESGESPIFLLTNEKPLRAGRARSFSEAFRVEHVRRGWRQGGPLIFWGTGEGQRNGT